MKVLLIGGVGEALALIAKDRPWLERMVLADYNLKRAREVRRNQVSRREECRDAPRMIAADALLASVATLPYRSRAADAHVSPLSHHEENRVSGCPIRSDLRFQSR